ncbi:MAG: hypothetical protein H6815_04520 [Phycisphaeraceae bacterium]|nr:hypothetical protein [Phycisphaerales bacterium]MCB9859697.1 hypothetical protein [Phycisphaeraceae bacterium]
MQTRHATFTLGTLLLVAGNAHAQVCVPSYETFTGQPAVVGGYLQPIISWDDGTGEQFYIGGSSQNIGGRKWLARWNADTGTFSSVGTGITTGTTNQFLTCFAVMDFGTGESLYVGGFYAAAGAVADTKSLARWDGTAWHSLGTGFQSQAGAPAVWAMTEYGNSLVVGGSFTDVGTVIGANGIAAYTGTTWNSLGSGIVGSFSPNVFALHVHNDGAGEKLFAGGRFDSIGGTSGPLVGAWNGNAWEAVGSLIGVDALAQISAFATFDDGSGSALYVTGDRLVGPGFFDWETAKWDGSTWNAVGQQSGGRGTALAVFDDGTGPALYQAGTAQPNVGYISRLENGTWVPLLGGVNSAIPSISGGFPSVFGLGAHSTGLYIMGNFAEIGGLSATGIARYEACDTCYADCDSSGSLNIFDYICFGNEYVAGTSYADCDGSGSLNVFDYICFGNAYAAGCP